MTQPQRRRDDEPTGNGPRPLNERLAELRETAKRDPSFLYLLPSSMEPPRQTSRRKPVLIVAAAGAGLAIGAVVVLALGGGGGGSAGSPTPDGPKPSSNAVVVPPASSDQPTATPTHAIPTPTPRSADDTVHEGAISLPATATPAPPDNPRLVTPLSTKARVLDHFGSPRGDGYIHGGTDLAPAAGSNAFDVFAACDGTVAGIDHSGTYGDFLVVDCGGGWKTIYANLAEITAPNRQGVAAATTKIGSAVGTVHFEVRYTDSSIDPERYINFAAGPLPPTPTPAPSPSPTPSPTSVPPSNGSGGTGATAPGSDNSPAPTSTPLPPTATPTPPPPTATATATPTSTPTPRPPRRTATPPPVIK